MSYPKQDGSGTEQGYNGWKNYETWNVSLWISNDKGLYAIARGARSYKHFVNYMASLDMPTGKEATYRIAIETPDGVAWADSELDLDALNNLLENL